MFQDQEKISNNQALMLLLAAGIGNIFVVIAVPAVKDAGRDAWLAVLLAYSLAILLGLILIRLGLRFPDKTLVQYLPKVLGRIPGKLVGLIYILIFWSISALIYRETVELIELFMLETPPTPINIMMAILVIYIMRKGFEVFSRLTELLVPIILFLIIFSLVFIFPNLEWKRLTPLLENGLLPVVKSLKVQFPYAIETILFMAFWLPSLRKKDRLTKSLLVGMSIAGILLTILVGGIIAFSGTVMTVSFPFPVYYLSRYILLADFLTGFEAIFIILWLTSSFIEILVFFYPAVVGSAQWLGLKDYRPLIIPMTIITIALSLVPANLTDVLILDRLKNPYLLLPLGLLIPVTWLIAVVRGIDES
ncbi:GerAB/ArcD/ProY family transporter [Acetohalobium arabaticum]|uniref:Spore germination protein n=1 Tax=Acetohalobium arabaticum (strain ATCC 49924 / DSM 5501 / Z-7288) TaxID=574087 RepID=D9QT70_ACEAZ|nr:endospore germination permease [Acetohalobium arabaticum]ADL13570.1 spore germination protein [Acetohalobium arabaticum DSM 5501]